MAIVREIYRAKAGAVMGAHSGPVGVSFALLLLFTFIFKQFRSDTIERALRGLAAFLLRRGLFRTPLESERTKMELLRILTGIVLFDRTLHTSTFVLSSSDPLSVKIVCVLVMVLALAFTVGIMTPIVSIILMFCNILIFDTAMRTYTLGSDVLSMLLLTFTFAPAGTKLSIDAVIVDRNLFGANIIQSIYAFVGSPTNLRLILAKSATLLCYSMICLYSVLLHIHESFWLSGDVGVHILSSSYWTKQFLLFRGLFEWSDLSIWLARLSMQGMIAWYFLLLPCILIGGWPRRIVIFWAFLFFSVSTFVLQLGWLGYYEFIFLALLFWNRAFMNSSGRNSVDILYDDRCNLCDRTVRVLRTLDIFGVLKFRPLTENFELVNALRLSKAQVLRDLYGYDRMSHKLYPGYDLYAELSKRLILLAWLAPVLILARWVRIGPALYRVIADRRTRWFGICHITVDHNRRKAIETPLANAKTRRGEWPTPFFTAFFVVHTALWPIHVAILPLFTFNVPLFIRLMAHTYGFMTINVFNQQDLQTSAHWFTISAMNRKGENTLIPFTGSSGERLGWHGSDRAYFSNSLVWRRFNNPNKEVCYTASDDPYLRDIIYWYRWSHTEVKGYEVTYYYQPLLELRHDRKPIMIRIAPRIVCTAGLDENGKVISIDRPQ